MAKKRKIKRMYKINAKGVTDKIDPVSFFLIVPALVVIALLLSVAVKF